MHWYLLAPVWVWVCYTDWRDRRIDHWAILCLAAGGLVDLYLSGHAVMPVLKQSMVILAIGYLVWQIGIIGAGDVKLFLGLSLWHVGEVIAFAFFMSVIGGVLALAYLALCAWPGRRGVESGRGIPYGIAIVLSSAALNA